MIKINSEVLKQFDKEGLSINKGIAIDARLVQGGGPQNLDNVISSKSAKNKKELII